MQRIDAHYLYQLGAKIHPLAEFELPDPSRGRGTELGYTGALDGSAEMNVWLHKQVMTKLAESGGKVPDTLKA